MNRHLPWHVQEDLPWAFSNKHGTPVGECFGTSNDNQRAKENAAHVVNCVNQRDKLAEALQSIATNTCCDRCQEAALVAKAVLTSCGLRCQEGK